MVHGDVEEPLNLLRVQVHGQNAVRARRYQEVRHQLGGDGHPRLVFAVLARIAVKRQHRGNPRCAGPAHRVNHDEHFHQMMVRGRAGGLHDEHVFAAHVFLDLHERFTVRKSADRDLPEFHANRLGNGFGQRRIRCPAENLHELIQKEKTTRGWHSLQKREDCNNHPSARKRIFGAIARQTS